MAPVTTKILDLADALLNGVVAEWPDDASPLPDLQYVSNGAVPWDGCEVLAVSYVRTFPAIEGDPTQEGITSAPGLSALRAAVYDVVLLRCSPDITMVGPEIVMPAVEHIRASGVQVLTDVQALTNAVFAAQKAGDIPGCSGLALENCTAAGPEGGMVGNLLRVRLATI